MLKNIIFGVKVATNDDFCQGTVPVLSLKTKKLAMTRAIGEKKKQTLLQVVHTHFYA